jgi:hypothetical protein
MPRRLAIYAAVSVLAVSVLTVSAAMAQTRTGACEPDIKKACADVKPGEGRIAACLKQHIAEVSDACKARLAEAIAAAKTCRSDVQAQCGTEKGRGRRLACIKDAVSKLSDDCKAAASAVIARKT